MAAVASVLDWAQPWAPGSTAHACPEGVSEFEDWSFHLLSVCGHSAYSSHQHTHEH